MIRNRSQQISFKCLHIDFCYLQVILLGMAKLKPFNMTSFRVYICAEHDKWALLAGL